MMKSIIVLWKYIMKNNEERNNTLQLGSRNLNHENWKVFHPNGKHMFTCGEKKAKWYLERNLADVIGNFKIQFTFTPNGDGFADNEEFGRGIRKNICVVSGRDYDLQRHHIVPYCYRTFFDDKYKSKNHHDVVLINHDYHLEYEKRANEFKDKISKIYRVKTISELNQEYTVLLREKSKKYSIILSALKSIFKSHDRMNDEIKLQKLKFVSDETEIPFKNMCEYGYIQLYKLYLLIKEHQRNELKLFKREVKKNYEHGYLVVQKLNTEEKIEKFVKLWRKHFLKITKPKYMPVGWSVDFRIKTKI